MKKRIKKLSKDIPTRALVDVAAVLRANPKLDTSTFILLMLAAERAGKWK